MPNALRLVPFVLSALAIECSAGAPTLVLRSGDPIRLDGASMPALDFSTLRLAQVGPSGDVAFNAERFLEMGGVVFVPEIASGIVPRDALGTREATAFAFRDRPIEGAAPLRLTAFQAPLAVFGQTSGITRVGRTGDAVLSGNVNGSESNLGVGLLRAEAGSPLRPVVVPASCDTPPVWIADGYDGFAVARRFVVTDDGRTLALAVRGCVSADDREDRVLVEERGGIVSEFFAVGAPAPDAPGETIGALRTVDFNRAGEVAVFGGLDDPDGPQPGFIPAIWSGTPGALSIVLRDGGVFPGQEGIVYGLSRSSGFPADSQSSRRDIAVHRGGGVSFLATVNASPRGIYRTLGGAPTTIAVSGEPAPGTSDFFDTINRNNTVLEAAGPDTTVVLTQWRSTPLIGPAESFGRGVWLSRGEQLELLLRDTDPIVDGRVVRDILYISGAPDGNAAIVARVSDAADPDADRSLVLFGWSPVDERLRIVAEQDLDLALDPFLEFDIEDLFDPDGGLAENGHIVYRVRRLGGEGEPSVVDEVFYDRLPSVNDPACAADFDANGTVDLGDFGVLGAAFNAQLGDDGYTPAADIDADGDVDLGDFGIFGAQFGRTDCGG